MSKTFKKAAIGIVKWSIAIGGIWWVVAHMSLRDSVMLLNPTTNLPVPAVLAEHADEDAAQFKVIDPDSGKTETVQRDQLINPVTKNAKTTIDIEGKKTVVPLLGARLEGDINRNPSVQQLLVQMPGDSKGTWIAPPVDFHLDVPRPRVEVGIISMVQHANPWLLILAVVVFPITFIITSYRWDKLLQAIEIQMSLWRAFEINMVGAFYNTFMPGSVGGDVFKMYYASKQTPHRTRAIICVFVDRILGLLALMLVGGVMALVQYLENPSLQDPTSRACAQIALTCALLMVAGVCGLIVLYQPTIRRMLGVEFILNKLPMQKQVTSAREVMRMYRQRPMLILWALLITIPVHVTVVISAILCGKAFGLPLRPMYYFSVVPVVVLVGSLPISPQGAGVMEFFAILLTQKQGATVSQAFALTMSIRVVQILWNLTGGIFVLRGGYHAPTDAEQKEMGEDQQAAAAE